MFNVHSHGREFRWFTTFYGESLSDKGFSPDKSYQKVNLYYEFNDFFMTFLVHTYTSKLGFDVESL